MRPARRGARQVHPRRSSAEINCAHDNKGGRKARKVFHAGMNGGGRHVSRTGGYSQQRRPAKDIGLGGPDEFPDVRRDRTTASRAVIEPWINV